MLSKDIDVKEMIITYGAASALIAAMIFIGQGQAPAEENRAVQRNSLDDTQGSATQCLITHFSRDNRSPYSASEKAVGLTFDTESIRDCFDLANDLVNNKILHNFTVAALKDTKIVDRFVCEREYTRKNFTQRYTDRCLNP